MKTKRSISSSDFQYAEFSGDVFCPFCNVLLKTTPLDRFSIEEENEELENKVDYYPDGGDLCKHVGFWSDSHFPSVNDNWRKEMFMLTSALNNQQYDGEAGYQWQEALLLAVSEEGKGCCIGWSAARAIRDFQVTIYRQFSYDTATPSQRYTTYVAIILRKKISPKAPKRVAIIVNSIGS